MNGMDIPSDSNVLVGSRDKDDAGVYRISDTVALVQTLDFITPLCDDPYDFGRIAACNSLSDVYTMGGRPVTAMNIVSFPTKKFSLDILGRILEGGQSAMNEAGVQLLGGHSVDDPEMKYGLSVTGIVHPDKIIRNNSIREGDSIILTKPLGTGIIATSVKAGMADGVHVREFIASMSTLNKYAAEIMLKYSVNACTDVTGFGLAGHLLEMIEGNELSIEVESPAIPILPGVDEYAATGLVPGGLYRNRKYAAERCIIHDTVKDIIRDIVFDPQTSGGLLISLPSAMALTLLDELKNSGVEHASIIGNVTKRSGSCIYIR